VGAEPNLAPQTFVDEMPSRTSEITPRAYKSLYVRLADDLRPHINYILSNRIAILGMPGAGKSNLVAVLCEAIAKFGTPMIIFDTKPEYAGMCANPFFINPMKVSAKNVNANNAKAFAKQVLSDRLQVVVDLRSYRDDDVAATVMIEMIEGIWEFEENRSKKLPCVVVIDEAHYWVSQGSQMNTVSNVKVDGVSLYQRLQKSIFNLLYIGRSFGVGSIVATQRPANIDKRAIAAAEWKFLLKANQPQDLSAYKDYGFGDEARTLKKGQAYVIGPNEFDQGTIHQIIVRESPDEATTPGVENLFGYDDSQVDDIDTIINGMPDIDPKDERYSWQEDTVTQDRMEDIPMINKTQNRRATLTDAIEVWNSCDGPIGRPRLRKELQAKGLECSDDLAGKLLAGIKERIED
jgi:hypothetical protein